MKKKTAIEKINQIGDLLDTIRNSTLQLQELLGERAVSLLKDLLEQGELQSIDAVEFLVSLAQTEQ